MRSRTGDIRGPTVSANDLLRLRISSMPPFAENESCVWHWPPRLGRDRAELFDRPLDQLGRDGGRVIDRGVDFALLDEPVRYPVIGGSAHIAGLPYDPLGNQPMDRQAQRILR